MNPSGQANTLIVDMRRDCPVCRKRMIVSCRSNADAQYVISKPKLIRICARCVTMALAKMGVLCGVHADEPFSADAGGHEGRMAGHHRRIERYYSENPADKDAKAFLGKAYT